MSTRAAHYPDQTRSKFRKVDFANWSYRQSNPGSPHSMSTVKTVTIPRSSSRYTLISFIWVFIIPSLRLNVRSKTFCIRNLYKFHSKLKILLVHFVGCNEECLSVRDCKSFLRWSILLICSNVTLFSNSNINNVPDNTPILLFAIILSQIMKSLYQSYGIYSRIYPEYSRNNL